MQPWPNGRSVRAGSRRARFLHAERCGQLFPKPDRIGRVHEAKPVHPAIAWPKIGTEHNIPYDEAMGIVVVGFLDLLRMVPAVHLRAAENEIEPAQAQIDIGVLEQSAGRIEHEVIGQDLRTYAGDYERQRIAEELQRFLQRVKPKDIGRIEFAWMMMH